MSIECKSGGMKGQEAVSELPNVQESIWRVKKRARVHLALGLDIKSFRLIHRTDFGTPLIKASFNPGEKFRADHSRQRENQDANKDFIGLKSCTRNGDHEADPGGCCIKLADHHTHDCAPKAEPQTRKNKWNRGRKHN